MIAPCRQPDETHIAFEHQRFGFARNTGKTKTRSQLAFIHHTAGKTLILDMLDQQNIEITRISQSTAHHQRISHRFARIGHKHSAGLFHQAEFGHFLTRHTFCQSGGWQHMHAGGIARTPHQKINDRRIIHNRMRIGHGDNCCYTPRRSGFGCRRQGLAIFMSRLADKSAQINQAGCHNTTFHINRFGIVGHGMCVNA